MIITVIAILIAVLIIIVVTNIGNNSSGNNKKPHTYSRKFVSTLVTDKKGESQIIVKGNISQIVARCSHVEFRGEILPIEKEDRKSVV